MNCPNCGKSLWFVRDVCPFCKFVIEAKPKPETDTDPIPTTEIAADLETALSDEQEMVTLTKCETLGEADAIRAQLEAAGIQVFLPDEALMQTVAWNLNTYGFIRVQVASSDYENARRVHLTMQEDKGEPPGEGAQTRAAIPLSWPMRIFAFLMPLLTCAGVVIFAVAKGAYTRQGCERKSEELWLSFAAGCVFWVLAGVVLASLGAFAR